MLLSVGVLLLAGCGSGGAGAGVRDEGPAARAGRVERATSTGSPSPATVKVDAVALVKNDPKAGAAIRRNLKPCFGNEYPLDVSYGELTGRGPTDVVVNVMTCSDAMGIGSYVYRVTDAPGGTGGKYENVFSMENPPVYASIDGDELVVTRRTYEKGDAVAYPSGEDVVTYRWAGDAFAEESRTHHDFSGTIGPVGDPADTGGPGAAEETGKGLPEAPGDARSGGPVSSPTAAPASSVETSSVETSSAEPGPEPAGTPTTAPSPTDG